MNHFNKKTTLNLQLVASILIFLVYSCNNENSTHLSNEFRKQNSIPMIEKSWSKKRINENVVLWSEPYRENYYTPYHFNKELKYNNLGKVIEEIDRFHYTINDTLELRLIYKYTYKNSLNPWNCKLIKYNNKKITLFGKEQIGSDVESEYILLEKADSILNSWNLSR